ncbi:MAG: hypothetical protein ACO3B1_06025, partial [Candidatus Nanopelagicaceae bacterium]
MASLVERRRIARLVHRFGFGPRPGEFSNLLASGFYQAAEKYLNAPSQVAFADTQDEPMVRDQGKRPAPNSPDVVAYATEKRAQLTSLSFWWLDR